MSKASDAKAIDPDLYYPLAVAARIQGISPRTLERILERHDAKVFVGARGHLVIPGWSLVDVFNSGLQNWSELGEPE